MVKRIPAAGPAREEGRFGVAVRVPIPARPEAAQSVDYWLLTCPKAHPEWKQYILAAVRLDNGVPGFAPPRRHFDGATHEILVAALDPDKGPYGADDILPRFVESGDLPVLSPVNIVLQFEADDDEVQQLCQALARGTVRGMLTPETTGAPERVREAWLASAVKTMDGLRGKEHTP